MNRASKLGTWVAAVALLSLTAAGCGSSDAADSGSAAQKLSTKELVKKAKGEGKAVWYAGGVRAQDAAAAFEKKYGIKVRVERLSGGALSQRVQGDVKSTGHLGADVIDNANMDLLSELVEQGLARHLTAKDVPGYPVAGEVKGVGNTCRISVAVIGYNTELLGKWRPKTWRDLLDPRLKGKLMVSDPNDSDAWATLWSQVLRTPALGRDYLKAVAAQGIQPVASSLVGAEQLGAGQGAALVAATTSLLEDQQKAKAPVGFFVPKDPSPVVPTVCMPAIGSAHPYAGELLERYLLSKEGQEVLNSTERAASVYTGLKGTLALPPNAAPMPHDKDFTAQTARVRKDLPEINKLLGVGQ
ncbi:ABC transporter substrate-binding protein [Streptomyces sp. NPDC102364]|uniref:ABC transporter substrate-binding protein n=1 Tax=Streptomyces sp. NPDC102364 TaxID=3366161 RepID=UPI0038146C53